MLTVADLQRQRQARSAVNHETYRQLWAQLQDRLRARADNNFTDLTWQVPPLVPGRPVYKPSHAARYLRDKLRLGGFDVTPFAADDVHVLYVSWKAVPPPPPPKKKKRHAAGASGSGSGGRVTMDEAARRLEKLKARLRL